MSSCWAHAYLGLKVSRDKIYEPVEECGHKPDHTQKFCPECGKPNIQERLRPYVTENRDESLSIGEFDVTQYNNRQFIIHLRSEATDDELTKIPLDVVDGGALRTIPPGEMLKFRDLMVKHDLWGEGLDFGIWLGVC